MAKKRSDKKLGIDRLPMRVQQHRSPPRKRRTDFSLFFCACTPHLNQVQCGEAESGKRACSNSSEDSIVCVELAADNSTSGSSPGRISISQKGEAAQMFECSPVKSQITECCDACVTPGRIVWAKTASGMWWPAEIKGRRTPNDSKNEGSESDGHVLVEYYGKQQSSWLDPATDLSQFDECFDERRCSPLEEFQDALRQALSRKEQRTSSRELFETPDGQNNSSQQERSLDPLEPSDKWNSSSSSRTEDSPIDGGRGKRKRMPKVRFDEVTFPSKSVRKVRRFRIMRYLGLGAPIGSPF